MTGRGSKRTRSSRSAAGGAGDGPSSSKRGLPQREDDDDDWCADCWSPTEAACRGRHRLLPAHAAEAEAKKALAEARREAEVQLGRVNAVQTAMQATWESKAPVLEAHVDGVDETSYCVDGGLIRIAVTAVKTLTAKDKKAICEALEDTEIEYKHGGRRESSALSARVEYNGDDLNGVLAKLADRVPGQTLQKGTVLLGYGCWEVFFQDAPPHRGSAGDKVFGRVTSGLSYMEGRGCEGDCERFYLDCLCRTGYKASSSVSDVKFVAS